MYQPQHKIVMLLHVHSVAVFRELLFIAPGFFFLIVLAVIKFAFGIFWLLTCSLERDYNSAVQGAY